MKYNGSPSESFDWKYFPISLNIITTQTLIFLPFSEKSCQSNETFGNCIEMMAAQCQQNGTPKEMHQKKCAICFHSSPSHACAWRAFEVHVHLKNDKRPSKDRPV